MNARHLSAGFIAALPVALIAGCSISPYEGKYRYEDGWRTARVKEVSSLELLERKYGFTCPQVDKAEKDAPVAIVGYRGGGRWRTQLMLLADKADGADFKADDLVYANIKQCAEPMIPRTVE